jgi:hypothetical protein
MLRYMKEDAAVRLLDKTYETVNMKLENMQHWMVQASPAYVTADIKELNVDVAERDETTGATLRMNVALHYAWDFAAVTLFVTPDETGVEEAQPFAEQEEIAATIWSFVKEEKKRIIQRRFKEIQNWQKQISKNNGKD